MAVDYVSIGKRIKARRREKGITQIKLGELVSVNSEHISRIEAGKKYLSLELLVLIANALDTSADDLLVDNLTHTSAVIGTELYTLLQNCNNNEKEILIRLLKYVRELLRRFNI